MIMLTLREDVKVDRNIEQNGPSNDKVVEIATRQFYHSKGKIEQ